MQLCPFTDPVAARTAPPRQIVRGEGATVGDADGTRFVDAMAGAWCAALGFADARLATAAADQHARLAYYHGFNNRSAAPSAALAARLARLLPGGLDRVFFASGGSEAVETAVKLAQYYWNARGRPEEKRIVARERAYHGSGTICAGLTGFAYAHDGFDLPGPLVLRTGRPHFHADARPGESEAAFARRRADELDRLIREAGPGTVGAFIGEPVMGAGGMMPPPQGYWGMVQEVLAAHDVLLIADEVITGFGRTGTWFARERYGIRPHMMTLAKQLTAAQFPLSAVAVEAGVAETIEGAAHAHGTLGHGFTYGGHPVGCAVAMAALDVYEAMDLPATVARLSADLAARLERLRRHPAVTDTRVIGFMAGVELSRGGAAVAAEAEARGVLLRAIGDVIALCPACVITPAELETAVSGLDDAIAAATAPAPA